MAEEHVLRMVVDAAPAEAGAAKFERSMDRIRASSTTAESALNRVATGTTGFATASDRASQRMGLFGTAISRVTSSAASMAVSFGATALIVGTVATAVLAAGMAYEAMARGSAAAARAQDAANVAMTAAKKKIDDITQGSAEAAAALRLQAAGNIAVAMTEATRLEIERERLRVEERGSRTVSSTLSYRARGEAVDAALKKIRSDIATTISSIGAAEQALSFQAPSNLPQRDSRTTTTGRAPSAAAADRELDRINKMILALGREQSALQMNERARFQIQSLERAGLGDITAQTTARSLLADKIREESGRLFDLDAAKRIMVDADPMVAFSERQVMLSDLRSKGLITEAAQLQQLEAAYDAALSKRTDPAAGMIRGFRNYASEAGNLSKNLEGVVTGSLSSMEDALVQFTMTGKFEWNSMINAIIADFARLMIRQAISGLVGSIFGGGAGGTGGGGALGGIVGGFFSSLFGSADGNVFYRGAPQPFANGGIVHRPTIFPMARGAGLMGEAGPEAIMPLTRTRNGMLGVRAPEGAAGGGTTIVVHNDLRGVHGEDAVEAAVMRGLAKAQPVFEKSTVNRVRDVASREPGFFGR